jgi:hypothetical protein
MASMPRLPLFLWKGACTVRPEPVALRPTAMDRNRISIGAPQSPRGPGVTMEYRKRTPCVKTAGPGTPPPSLMQTIHKRGHHIGPNVWLLCLPSHRLRPLRLPRRLTPAEQVNSKDQTILLPFSTPTTSRQYIRRHTHPKVRPLSI